MSLNQPIRGLEKAKSIPQGTAYVASMGDGSGTMAVTQEVLTKAVGEELKIGDPKELQTENKESFVDAINEVLQSRGGGGDSVDILDSKEEIEANTEAEKVAGALAVKEMFGVLNDKLGLETRENPNDSTQAQWKNSNGDWVNFNNAAEIVENSFSGTFTRNSPYQIPRTYQGLKIVGVKTFSYSSTNNSGEKTNINVSITSDFKATMGFSSGDTCRVSGIALYAK